MIRIFKRFRDLLDTPTPEPGKFIRWNEGGTLENTDEIIIKADNNIRYQMLVVIDPATGIPAIAWKELT